MNKEQTDKLLSAYKAIEKILQSDTELNITKVFEEKEKEQLYKLLDEDSIYLVEVKHSPSNIEHKAVLFTGFKNGGYWEVYNNSYDTVTKFKDLYSIKVERKLCSLKE